MEPFRNRLAEDKPSPDFGDVKPLTFEQVLTHILKRFGHPTKGRIEIVLENGTATVTATSQEASV